jgi:hypothetical protein
VIVPSLPVITLLRVSARGGFVLVSLGCRGPDGTRCVGNVRVIVIERIRGRQVVAVLAPAPPGRSVVLGQRRYALLSRHVTTIHMALKPSAARLERQFVRVPATLTVSQTTVAGTRSVAMRSLKLRPLSAPRSR